MRAAPPVDHPLARLGLWAGAGAVLAVLVAAAPLWWLGSHMRAGGEAAGWGRVMLTLLTAAAAFGLCWQHAAKRPAQRLRWDGTGWQLLTGDTAEGLDTPSIRIDLGHALLLCAREPSRRLVWLALERRDAPATWHRLRVAVNQPLRPTPPAARPDGGLA